MMKFFAITLLLLILGFGCRCSPSPLSEKEILFNKIISDFTKQMANEDQMIAYGAGGGINGGATEDKICDFVLRFACPRVVDVSQARTVILDCMKKLLNNIDIDENIRPYLIHYPYPSSGIDLIIKFYPYEKENSASASKYVHTVFCFGDSMLYRQYDVKTNKDITILKETYQEALEKTLKIIPK